MRRSWFVCAGALLLLACEAEAPGPETHRRAVATPPAPTRALQKSPAVTLMRTYRCPYRGYTVELPRPGYRVRNRSYDPTLPPRKFRNRLIVLRDGLGPVITLDVWENPLGLALQKWFERFLSGTVSEQAIHGSGLGTRHRIPVLLFAEPRSPQSPPRRVAVWARSGLMFRLRCLNADDDGAVDVYEQLLGSFHLPGVRP